MILDKLAKLGAAQAFTGSNEVTTDSYDCGNPTPKNRVGTGTRLSLMFVVTTAAAGDSASVTDTCDFAAVEDSGSNLATAKVIMIQRRVPAASLTVGAIVEVPIPIDRPLKRYIGGQVLLGTGDTLSADSYIVPSDHVQQFLAYAKGYAV